MSKTTRAPAMSDDSDREGKLCRPGGVEGSMNHGQGGVSKDSALSQAVSTVKMQVARGKSAPTVGGRKMTDY
jgi:hypothetical protein